MYIGNSEIVGGYVGTNMVSAMYLGTSRIFPLNIVHNLVVSGPLILNGETFKYAAVYDTSDVSSSSIWSIVSGGTYASINSSGLLTISSIANNSPVKIQASYGDLTAEKDVVVTYVAGSSTSSETEAHVVIDESGNTATTVETRTTITDTSGNVTTVISVSEITENVDGTSVSTESETTQNPDGTSTRESTTITYNTEGDPVEKTNENVDTEGNVSTQEIEYDSSGNEVVTGYDIDTDDNPDGYKNFNINGVNTEYYAFDMTHGFVMDIHFTIDYSQQPPDQDDNHHQIVTMKRATPEPWYGFQIRQTRTNKYIQLGTQFSSGSNANTNISGTTYQGDSNVHEFNLRITYNPIASSNTFVCYDVMKSQTVFSSNGVFPDIAELRYLKVTIGCALDANGDPFRYSNINVMNFSIKRLNVVPEPVISCDGQHIVISCSAPDAVIYYKLNQVGSYATYSIPISISSDTVVESYATLGSASSDTVSATCIYTPAHDYSFDYLTFRVLTGGTIGWAMAGSGYAKVIDYSINDGQWTSITAATTPSTFSVSDNDVVRFRGTNTTYAGDNTNYAGFSCGTAYFNIEGNIMSLVYGDNFVGQTGLTGTYNFCSLFKQSRAISAENLILPSTTLTPHCYRALFANNPDLEVAPVLPATVLAHSCYRYMFQDCAITTAPDLLATTVVTGCYEGMFNRCTSLNYIKCMATNINNVSATTSWVSGVSSTGTFVKDANTEWPISINGIPRNWVIVDEGLKNPTITCNGLYITLTCGTLGASVYYRLNEQGEYVLYSTPISISADTICQAYSQSGSTTSSIVTENCIYDDGLEEPVIYCDGMFVSISCETGGATIYYRFNQTGAYAQYDSAIEISADTICESYSEIDGIQSEIVSANCIYDATLRPPVIECDGTAVTITCTNPGADIYYRLNQAGDYELYESAITISANTVVEAYSEFSGETSSLVVENCIYDPTHHYENDYLTFRVLTGGTIIWNSIGAGQSKTILYSKNNGAWTSISASSASTISVAVNDVVRFKGSNASYAKDKSNYSGFEGGTAYFNIEGNIMSLVYGDNFVGQTGLTGTYNFCSIFKLANCVSAENLILPATTLTNYCYRAMFSKAYSLTTAPALPATTLAQGCYWYMFEACAITEAPELLAPTLVRECYGYMFTGCTSLNYIKCMAVSGFSEISAKTGWVGNVASNGTFVKDSSVSISTWTRGNNGIPSNWTVFDNVSVSSPSISCDGENVTMTCSTQGAGIYYRTGGTGNYSAYTSAITITATTVFNAYAELNGQDSIVVTQTCDYVSDIPFEASNRLLNKWNYNNVEITTPYSVNAIDGHSASYAKGTFNFETTFGLRQVQPAYLWFQHADQSASIYIDNTLVEKHWGGYNAFFVDLSGHVHSGSNIVKVAIKNNEGNYLAPAAGDFNFNATLGNVKLFTSPYLPAMNYGYDGFHVTADVAVSSATIYVRTNIPTGATVTLSISDGTYSFSTSGNSTGQEMVFSTTISNPHLWNGILDPHLYTITMEIYHNDDLYHRYQRPYGLRFYSYVINDTTVLSSGTPYTGFLLNGSPYLLRGVCMHDDIYEKANALNETDYTKTFDVIQELKCNFIRLAHYPHPKEVYDRCDQIGIIVQTEVPCVNKLQSTMPSDYYTHLNGQYDDMVNQHYNHPCILFWGLSNETTTDDASFANTKINGYISRIKALDSERMVGYVMAQSASDPSAYYNNPNADWFGANIYEGWYSNKNSNNPSSVLSTRITNIITNKHKALAYSEYGCGGTQRCHSDDFMTTTTRGNFERHDIEYMMWLHEGHIAVIKSHPELLFTAQWQLFDIAVSNRNEGYTVCLDGETTSIDDNLRRLNNKGLVERDHVTKKDPFYLYKAWWNTSDKFVHICGKNYTKKTDRVIKCYTNDGSSLSLYVNGQLAETVNVTDNIATFTSSNYNVGDVIQVTGSNSNDTFTF